MKTEFLGLLEELFEIESGEITGNEKLSDLKGWSSLLFVALIAMVDEEYEVTLDPKAVLGCPDINALTGLIQSKKSSAQAA